MKTIWLIKYLCFVFAVLLFACCTPKNENNKQNINAEVSRREQSEGTKKMVSIMKAIADSAKFYDYFYLNTERAQYYQSRIPLINDPAEKRAFRVQYAYELLSAGKSQEAATEYKSLIDETITNNKQPEKYLLDYLAISYLRMGEQQNCCSSHNDESCMIPIKGKGIHKNRKGSESAIAIYSEILKKYPDDLGSRWLLNLAFMTLGEYPEKVPVQWLIPAKAFESDYSVPKFKEIATALKLNAEGISGGSCIEDFDNDGFLDIMCSSYGLRDQIKYFHNNGDGTFSDKTDAALLTGIVSGLNLIHTDYNNDGFADVLILRGGWLNYAGNHPNSLLKNNGDGTFDDVTIESGLLSYHPTQTAAWADFNGDGWLDVFIGNESTDSLPHPCELYLNNKNGTFTNVAAKLNLDIVKFVKGVCWGDINNDAKPDLYVSVLTGKNLLYLNKGGKTIDDWKFENISASSGIDNEYFSFPCWFWDYDNDGWQDIFVSGYDMNHIKSQICASDFARELLKMPSNAATMHLYHNNGNNTFTDVSAKTKLNKVCYTMGSNFGDIDNDGWLDCYLGTGNPDYQTLVPNKMFRNHDGKYFDDVTTAAAVGNAQKGHGVSFGDLDNDGDQDIFIKMGGAIEGDVYQSLLFENPGNQNNWITIKCVGVKSNKAAIGTALQVICHNKENVSRSIFVRVGTGGSFGSSSLQQEIGLGDAVALDSLIITWPDGKNTKQVFSNIKMNQKIKITEGNESFEKIALKKITF